MITLPVMARELKVEAKKPVGYRMRFLIGTLAFLAFGLPILAGYQPAGEQAFEQIHQMVVLILALSAPLLTADTISREKREGTLGLLQLTTLKPAQIAGSKFFVQIIKVLQLWLLLVPFVSISLLLGGVTWSNLVFSLITDLWLILLGLSCGFIASSLARQFIWSLILAYVLFVVIGTTSLALTTRPILNAFITSVAGQYDFVAWAKIGITVMLNPNEITNILVSPVTSMFGLTASSPFYSALLALFGCQLFISIILLLVGITWVGRVIGRKAEKEQETAGQIWFRKKFLTPRFLRSAFTEYMRRKMDSNPLIWLEI
jgi:ABC-type transport system involved in cytochrome c biogenesis permease component